MNKNRLPLDGHARARELGQNSNNNTLRGYLLVAHPSNPDDLLSQAVILITDHQVNGASAGIIINSPLSSTSIKDLAQVMGFDTANFTDGDDDTVDMLHWGGQSLLAKIYVLHTDDWFSMTTRSVTDDIYITSDRTVISAVIADEGPKQYRAVAGVCTWSNLDLSLKRSPNHQWLTVPAHAELVFGQDSKIQWQQCLAAAVKHTTQTWIT